MNTRARAIETNIADSQPLMLLPATVGFFFSFRVFIVLLSVRVFQADAQNGTAFGLALNFVLLAVVLLSSLGPASTTLASIRRLPCAPWVLLFFAFSGCSLLWSVTVSLPAAAAFWCAMVADTAMVVLLLRIGPIHEMSFALMKGYIYGACSIALVAWIMPAQSDLRLGDEELLGPNQIGYVCALAIFFAQYLIRSKQGRWTVAAAFLAITLLRSLSKTTIIAFIAGQALILVWDKSIGRRTKILFAVAATVVIALFWGLLSSYYEVYTGASNQVETLTGRLGIWAYILVEALDNPWFGHGFHSVWKVIPPFGVDQFEARHAHNELIQQFYAYGAMGVFMLIALYVSFFRHVKTLQKSPLRTLLLGLLVFALVRGFADTEAFDISLPLWSIAMFSATTTEIKKLESSSLEQEQPL